MYPCKNSINTFHPLACSLHHKQISEIRAMPYGADLSSCVPECKMLRVLVQHRCSCSLTKCTVTTLEITAANCNNCNYNCSQNTILNSNSYNPCNSLVAPGSICTLLNIPWFLSVSIHNSWHHENRMASAMDDGIHLFLVCHSFAQLPLPRSRPWKDSKQIAFSF